MPQTIAMGAKGVDVAFLQCILNKNGAFPPLDVDGVFGSKTSAALKIYQKKKTTSPPDGIAGPKTWASVKSIREYRHRVTLYAQPNNTTCWSAAATMMFPGGPASIGAGIAKVLADGTLDPTLANIEVFVEQLGWRIVNNISNPPPSMILNAMARSPAWVVIQGSLGFAHAVVLSAIITDGDESGAGTAFEVMDPWPATVGTKYASGFVNQNIILRSLPAKPTAGFAFIATP